MNNEHFFCQACLDDKKEYEMSEDARYCKDCCDFLLKEAELISGNRRPGWIPKLSINRPFQHTLQAKMGQAKQCLIPQGMGGNMSTLENENIIGDIIQPRTLLKPQIKRGPKHRLLPEDLIRSLAEKGMGSKAIASKLNSELGITVSYKTIQRLLSGGREFDKQTENKLSDKQGNLALLQHLILK